MPNQTAHHVLPQPTKRNRAAGHNHHTLHKWGSLSTVRGGCGWPRTCLVQSNISCTHDSSVQRTGAAPSSRSALRWALTTPSTGQSHALAARVLAFPVWRGTRVMQPIVQVLFVRRLAPLGMKWACSCLRIGGMSHSSWFWCACSCVAGAPVCCFFFWWREGFLVVACCWHGRGASVSNYLEEEE